LDWTREHFCDHQKKYCCIDACHVGRDPAALPPATSVRAAFDRIAERGDPHRKHFFEILAQTFTIRGFAIEGRGPFDEGRPVFDDRPKLQGCEIVLDG
jgi:hypothetical protein